jgi:predicted nucleic acid-binding protein
VASYLLDTDILSELMARPARRRRQRIDAWLRSLADEPVLLSSVSIAEINRGIALLKDQGAADSLRFAPEQIVLAYGDTIITPSHSDWQTFARLSAIPALRPLCYGKNKNNLPRTGADVFLAVQAVSAECAIASCNGGDFTLIDSHFGLSCGVFNPATGTWARAPDA